jgi:hypothetical protein
MLFLNTWLENVVPNVAKSACSNSLIAVLMVTGTGIPHGVKAVGKRGGTSGTLFQRTVIAKTRRIGLDGKREGKLIPSNSADNISNINYILKTKQLQPTVTNVRVVEKATKAFLPSTIKNTEQEILIVKNSMFMEDLLFICGYAVMVIQNATSNVCAPIVTSAEVLTVESAHINREAN